MLDPIHPEHRGLILDVARLRKLINDPNLSDEMEIYVSLSSDPEEGTSVPMECLELVIVTDEPNNRIVFTFDSTKGFTNDI